MCHQHAKEPLTEHRVCTSWKAYPPPVTTNCKAHPSFLSHLHVMLRPSTANNTTGKRHRQSRHRHHQQSGNCYRHQQHLSVHQRQQLGPPASHGVDGCLHVPLVKVSVIGNCPAVCKCATHTGRDTCCQCVVAHTRWVCVWVQPHYE